jgi:hypothetical protein
MTEDFDCATEYASYFCNLCGFASNSEAAQHPKKAIRTVPKELRPFVEWAEFAEDSEACYRGRMLFWPGAVEMMTQYSVYPVVVSGKLKWRREDIEKIPDSERKRYPRKDGLGGHYEYRSADHHADYDTFHEACEATPEQNLANALLSMRRKWRIRLLSQRKTGANLRKGRKKCEHHRLA